jgi:hypothetical protein
VSDIGIEFPPLFIVGLALLFALPVTTAFMAGLGIVWRRLRRRDPNRRLTALKWSAAVVAPFWLTGLIFGGLWLVSEIEREIYGAQHYFMLDKAAEIDGVSLPAGTQVTLDEDRALQVAELPDGATLELSGAIWQGRVEFAMPAHAPDGKHGQITAGTLAAPAIIQNVPCRAGNPVAFFWGSQLMECTLSQDTDLKAPIDKPDGVQSLRMFRCRAGDAIQFDGLHPGELGGCRLAEPANFNEFACAAGERILISNGYLSTCTLANAGRFGPLTLPPGTTVDYYDAQPSRFSLPSTGPAVDGFGLRLPAGTEASFCYRSEALERLEVTGTAYVTVEGVKLTGPIDFNCGPFRSGVLFEDTMIRGQRRQRDELVSQEDLSPK